MIRSFSIEHSSVSRLLAFFGALFAMLAITSTAFADIPIYVDFDESISKVERGYVNKALKEFSQKKGYPHKYKVTGAELRQALSLVDCEELSDDCFIKLAKTTRSDQLAYISVAKLPNSNLVNFVLNTFDALTVTTAPEEHLLKSGAYLDADALMIIDAWASGYPLLTSFVAKGPKTYDLKIEGADLGKLPRALTSLFPDKYIVVVESEGKPVASKVVEVSVDKPARIVVAGDSEEAAAEIVNVKEQTIDVPPPPELTIGERFEDVRVISWVTAGIGAAVLVTGGFMSLGAHLADKDADDIIVRTCGNKGAGGSASGSDCANSIRKGNDYVFKQNGKEQSVKTELAGDIVYQSAISEARSWRSASYVTYALGSAILAGGIALIVYDLVNAPREDGPYYSDLGHEGESLPIAEKSSMRLKVGASLNYVEAGLVW